MTAPAPERPLPGDPDEPVLPDPDPVVPRPIEPEPESEPEPLIPGGEVRGRYRNWSRRRVR
jgi:hypothetical protein